MWRRAFLYCAKAHTHCWCWCFNIPEGLQYGRVGWSLWRHGVVGLCLSARSAICVARVSRFRESGLIAGRVVVVYGRLWWRINGLYSRSTLGVMASAIVLGLVLGMGIQDDRWRLDFCHLVLLQKIWTSWSTFKDKTCFFSLVELTSSLKKGL